ncbi:Mo25-like protein [Microthyrium microscopicum]|uniref:Mo25-like protein n=1 Tax=Microthyrium microscopicum TaxID=703497 RepID=A0A6A6UJR5_9PEZI|nr:Mo25-like protein [Microthyrium microscopicum]
MAFLFPRNKQKTTVEIVRSAKESLQKLSSVEQLPSAQDEALSQKLAQMKLILQGTQETEVSPEQVFQLINLLLSEDLLYLLATNIHKIPFEARKDTQAIFSNAFRYKSSGQAEPTALHYVLTHRPQIITALCHGYDRRESAMPCGGVLREALKYDAIAALILYDEPTPDGQPRNLAEVDTTAPASGKGVFWLFFDWIVKSSFEVCADAFSTFREILTKHKALVATYLETNFTEFFTLYNRALIQSDNYVTKRQSIKLLGELLLDRANYSVMTAYVDSAEHLKLCMKLLLDDRRMINYEGFHVFKVFVANPNKSYAVQRMLVNNRERLLRFLPGFLNDRTDDDQFMDERSFLIRQIELLPQANSEAMAGNPDS